MHRVAHFQWSCFQGKQLCQFLFLPLPSMALLLKERICSSRSKSFALIADYILKAFLAKGSEQEVRKVVYS